MKTLLVLGSKPSPSLPGGKIDAVVCANASGLSARSLDLPTPILTCLSAVLTSGNASDEHSLRRLQGLRTQRAYFIPRPRLETASGLDYLRLRWKMRRLLPREMRRRLAALDYGYETFEAHSSQHYYAIVMKHAGESETTRQMIAEKQPSTGVIATALALEEPGYDRVVMAGFDFTLSHAYGDNPLIAERGNALSKHADTDVHLLRGIAGRNTRLMTSEPVVAERTGLPLAGA
ncbi:MAG: hypothetical protein AAFY56_14930 [Pseudomonadota bacterium]